MPDPNKIPDLIENLSDDGAGDSGHHERDLVEHLPPGPDRPVIKKTDKVDVERGWFLVVFLAMLMVTIVIDLAGSALLSAPAWAKMRPEVAEIRSFLFQVTGVIIGFYFGSTMRHRGGKN